MKTKEQAFTLIELLISLSIIIILTTIAVPSFDKFIERRSIQAHVEKIARILITARLTAVNQNTKVTLCPSGGGTKCGKNWSQGFLAFIDNNGDRQYNGKDEVIYSQPFSDTKLKVKWNAFGHKKSVQWLETGITNHQNGSFIFCYDKKPTLARGLFITKPGRIRYSKDRDGDAIHEDAKGNPIVCVTSH